MQYLLILTSIICIILLVIIIFYQKELLHLCRQLDHIDDGSRIELTSNVRSRNFLKLYRRLNKIFRQHHQELQEQLVYKDQLTQSISNIAHDIRTPLTSASGYMQMLSECEEEEKRKRYEGVVLQRLFELKDMLEEMFLYTKLTSRDFHLDCERVAVFPALSSSMVSLYHLFEERNSEPDITFEEEGFHVKANKEALERVFKNLIHNALLHGLGDLKIIQKENSICFINHVKEDAVIDTEKLFERFYKADSTRKKGSSGLGLAIVNELMQRMDGSAEVKLEKNILEVKLNFLSLESNQPYLV